ncbi:MAG: hypothetical protein RIQ72_4 [Candidatus Parcubacteria bacterium]
MPTKDIIKTRIEQITAVHSGLSHAKSIKPTPVINAHFSSLVDIVQNSDSVISNKILNNPKIKKIKKELRSISAQGEYELERAWADVLVHSKDIWRDIEQFPYIENYKSLTDFEMSDIDSCIAHNKKHRVLFIGSGPLPLSSIYMAKKHNLLIDNVEIDSYAHSLSQKIIHKLKLDSHINNIHSDILDIKDFSKYNLIFVAALAGADEKEKMSIIRHIKRYSAKGTHIILRSVVDLGNLLYPKITPAHLKGLQLINYGVVHSGVINNIIITKT